MKKTVLIISFLSVLLTNCGSDPAGEYQYQPPEKIDDGIMVDTLDDVTIESAVA